MDSVSYFCWRASFLCTLGLTRSGGTSPALEEIRLGPSSPSGSYSQHCFEHIKDKLNLARRSLDKNLNLPNEAYNNTDA